METYLVHHGILGQRWGVRRYQNPDGTLTALGKARFSETSPKKRLENGDYIYKKGTVVGRFGSDSNWDKNNDVTYLYTNQKDRSTYSNRFGGEELIYKFKKDIKVPSPSKQYTDLLDFVKNDNAVSDYYYYAKDEPFDFWKDYINQGGGVADRYYSNMKKKGYDALIDFRNVGGIADDPIVVISPQDSLEEVKKDNHLAHHGILGQKWGVRRYQNPDGTLTAEGKKRQRAEDKLYREKSLKKVDKYYNENYHYGAYGLMNKQGIKTLKQRIAIEEDKVTKRDLKLALKYNEKLKELEKEKVSKLTHDQIMNERKIAGKSYMKAVGATVASSIALPGISWVIVLPSPQKDLSYNRISENERSKVLEDLKPKNYKGNLVTYKNAEKRIRRKTDA